MRTICHIGHHKTGTTSLQAFLSQNALALAKAGILYPWVESQGATLALARAVKGQDCADIMPINYREAHNALAFRMLADALPAWKVPGFHKDLPASEQMLLAIANQMKELEPQHVVLVSEVMSHFGKSAPDQISSLRQEALAQSEEFTLWCTLRRPDEQLVSWHGQQVRFGQSPAALSHPKGLNLKWLHVDYRGVLKPWIDTIPEVQLVLRPYPETLAAGGSVQDLLRNSGIRFPARLIGEQKLNISQKPAVISLLRKANQKLPQPLARKLAAQMNTIAEHLKLAPAADVELLGAENRGLLLDHFRPIHDWLSQTSGRPAFFPDLEDMATCRPLPEAEALQQLLDQMTPAQIARLTDPALQDFMTEMRKAPATV